ncbi:flagellin [Natronorubrum halophilum]|uniref:flagellin n=1 Tax=Natronorubrum halophilum TaxID=1702106 RepID=UPI000EF66734|nr:flagellin [Natronorubrum halophilum]
MGFSTSGATAIIFVGVLMAAGIAYPVLQTAHDERLTAIDDRDDRTLEIYNSDLALEESRYNETERALTVNVTNAGSTTLSVPATDLLVDGKYVELDDGDTLVDGSERRELWQPGETLSITVEADRPERVKIVTEHGLAKTLEV